MIIFHMCSLTEKDVGILEFIGEKNEGFCSILKMRYYDFLVNEINMLGEIVHLKQQAFEANSDESSNSLNTVSIVTYNVQGIPSLMQNSLLLP